jgi:hypothetical protein
MQVQNPKVADQSSHRRFDKETRMCKLCSRVAGWSEGVHCCLLLRSGSRGPKTCRGPNDILPWPDAEKCIGLDKGPHKVSNDKVDHSNTLTAG